MKRSRWSWLSIIVMLSLIVASTACTRRVVRSRTHSPQQFAEYESAPTGTTKGRQSAMDDLGSLIFGEPVE